MAGPSTTHTATDELSCTVLRISLEKQQQKNIWRARARHMRAAGNQVQPPPPARSTETLYPVFAGSPNLACTPLYMLHAERCYYY